MIYTINIVILDNIQKMYCQKYINIFILNPTGIPTHHNIKVRVNAQSVYMMDFNTGKLQHIYNIATYETVKKTKRSLL